MGSSRKQAVYKWQSDGSVDFLQLVNQSGAVLGWIDPSGLLNGSLLASLAGLGTISFAGVPTGSCTSQQTAVNSGTGDFYSCSNGAWVKIGPTASSLASPVSSPNPLAFDVNVNFKGPNPYVDVARYGVRAINPNTAPALSGITATINSGSASAALSSASTFQNGDGVVIYGAGAPHSMSTPGAPTITPSVARVMTGTGDVVNGPTGAKTYNYKVVARDVSGGLTAASSLGSTTTGATSLGSQSVSVASASRSNNVVTVTTSSAHGLTVGSMVYIQVTGGNGITGDAQFGGWYSVSGTSDNTHFTFSCGLDTRNGAPASTSGGFAATVFWFNCNHVSWSAVAGAYQYYIYSDRANPGTFALVGVSRPVNGSFTDGALFWDDFGSPMMDNLTAVPGNVPSTAPSSPTSDNLITTISSGAGTTTLVLAANAGTSVSGATIRFDNGPNIKTAATAAAGAPLYFSIPASGSYVINSITDLTGTKPTFIGNSLVMNETLIGVNHWYAKTLPVTGTGTQFEFESMGSVTCSAIPCLHILDGSSGYIEGLQFTGSGNGNLLILQDAGSPSGSMMYDRVQFVTGTSSDYMGIGFMARGIFGDGTAFQMRRVLFTGGPDQVQGASATPLLFADSVGTIGGSCLIDSIFLNRRGILFRSGGDLRLNWAYVQGGITPFFVVSGLAGNGNTAANIDFGHVQLDTMAHPLATYLPSQGTADIEVKIGYTNGPSSSASVVTGNVFDRGVYAHQQFGSGLGQDNTQLVGLPVIFANLPASASNFTIVGCSDCTTANPCAGGGTGAFAKRLNGVWVCN